MKLKSRGKDPIDKVVQERRLTYSGWLLFVKKLSRKEISDLFYNTERSDELNKEYLKWTFSNESSSSQHIRERPE